jgi:Concanavalin A-like lectin/glucanases superfamily/Putative Ig domain
MPSLILDEWIDLGVRGCRSIAVTQRRTAGNGGGGVGGCEVVSIEQTPVELQENLVAGWDFEAESAGSHLAAFTNSTFANFGAPTIVPGHIRNAVRIPAGAGLVGSFSEADFAFNNAQFTLSLWIKFEGFPAATADIISKADSNTGYILRISNTGTLTWFIGNGVSYTSVAWGTPLSLNTWYQVICGWDGSNVVLQVNTESVLGVAATSALNPWVSSGQNLTIPLVPASTADTFLVDSFIAWSSFLSLTDRTTLWNSGAGLPVPVFGGGQIPEAIQGNPYKVVLTAVGGTAPYTWSIASGALPSGMSSSLAGVFSGTPTEFGDFSFRIRVQDDAGNSCEQDCTLHVVNSLLVDLAAVWHFDANFTDEIGPYTFASQGTPGLVAGKLSNAVRIEPAEGLIDTTFQSSLAFSVFTWHLWIKFTTLPNGAQTYVDVIRKSNNAQGYILRVDDVGAVTFFVGDFNQYNPVTFGSNLSTNTWYQIICGRGSDGNINVQVNSESVLGTVVSAGPFSIFPSSDPLNIPDDPPGTHTSDFLVDELDAWDGKFLSLAERTYLWNSGAGRAYPFS